MKGILKFLTAAMVLATVFAGCRRECADFDPNGGSGITGGEIGYISFSSEGLSVEWGGENVSSPNEGQTRAGVDTEDWYVTVERVNPSAGTVETLPVSDIQAEPYGLPATTDAGQTITYKLKVYSAETPVAAWSNPTYTGESEVFSVDASVDTQDKPKPIAVQCSLASVKVSVSLEESMAQLTTDATFEVVIFDPATQSVDDPAASLTYDEKLHPYGVARLDESSHKWSSWIYEPECAYFKPAAADNAITLKMDMMYKGQHVTKNLQICYSGRWAHANEYRRILLYIDEPTIGSGDILIGATIETLLWNAEVDVDVVEDSAFFSKEPGIDDDDDDENVGNKDENAPQLGSDIFSFTSVNNISASDYSGGTYNGAVMLTVSAKSDITSFTVQLSTDNEAFESDIMGSYNITSDTVVDLADTSAAERAKRSFFTFYGFPQKIEGTELSFDIADFFNDIYEYDGNYTFTFVVTDSEGHSSTNQLKISYDSDGNGGGGDVTPADAPTIIWIGHDIDQCYEVVPDLDVKIEVTAEAGIKSFLVHISGSIMEDPMMTVLEEIDLIHPGESKDLLEYFGFPVEGKVENQTFVTFDISEFMPMLGSFSGNSYFQLEVTDNNGKTSIKTIQLLIK